MCCSRYCWQVTCRLQSFIVDLAARRWTASMLVCYTLHRQILDDDLNTEVTTEAVTYQPRRSILLRTFASSFLFLIPSSFPSLLILPLNPAKGIGSTVSFQYFQVKMTYTSTHYFKIALAYSFMFCWCIGSYVSVSIVMLQEEYKFLSLSRRIGLQLPLRSAAAPTACFRVRRCMYIGRWVRLPDTTCTRV